MLELIARVLRGTGHEVTSATGARAALHLLATTPFDVALVDYRMPVRNGLEVLLTIRELQPQCVRILVSGALELPVLIDAVNRGEVNRVMEKPFRSDTLLALIAEALEARTRVEELHRQRHAQD